MWSRIDRGQDRIIMKINFRETDLGYIFDVDSTVLTFELLFSLEKSIQELPCEKSVALNLQNVEVISNEFFEFIKKFAQIRKISLINIQSDIFVLLNLTCYDKYAKIFLNDFDFEQDKRMMVNRRLTILR